MKQAGSTSAEAEVLLSQRARDHFVYRAVSRAYGSHAANPGPLSWAHARSFGIGFLADLTIWQWLRRSDGLNFVPRLVIDAADIELHSHGVQKSPEAAMLIGVPLATESAIRKNALGMVVPAAHLAVATALRRRRGQSTPVLSVMSQVQGAVVGMATGAYFRRQHRQILAEREQALEAQVEAASLAGQTDVALRAGSVVDQLSSVEYMLAIAGDAPVGKSRTMARWKASLAAASTAESTFLRVVVSRWATARRTSTLIDDVEIDMDDRTGSVVLTRAQATQLVGALDALAPHGNVTLTTPDGPGVRLVGEPLRVEIGDYELVLGAESALERRLDPGPALVAAGLVWNLALSSNAHGRVPLPVTAAGSALSVGLAGWIDRSMRSGRSPQPMTIIGSAVAVGTAQALVATMTMRSLVDDDGVQVLPAVLTLMAPALLAGRYSDAPDAPPLTSVAAMFAAAIGVSLLPLNRVNPTAFLTGCGEIVGAYLVFSRIQQSLDEVQGRIDATFDERQGRDTGIAHEAGRQRALDLVATEAARLRVALDADGIDAELAAEIRRRLDLVEAELGTIR